MGLDATKPFKAPEMVFKRIHVPGEEAIDVDEVLKQSGSANWRSALKS
jgi:2,5-furandicarboxylate decarboxylase 1